MPWPGEEGAEALVEHELDEREMRPWCWRTPSAARAPASSRLARTLAKISGKSYAYVDERFWQIMRLRWIVSRSGYGSLRVSVSEAGNAAVRGRHLVNLSPSTC